MMYRAGIDKPKEHVSLENSENDKYRSHIIKCAGAAQIYPQSAI